MSNFLESEFCMHLRRDSIAPVGDPEGEIALEALHSGRYGSCDARPTTMRAYELGPGQGIFIPPRSAHFVENGPGPCTALSVVFLHRLTKGEVSVHAWNARLRRMGLTRSHPASRCGATGSSETRSRSLTPCGNAYPSGPTATDLVPPTPGYAVGFTPVPNDRGVLDPKKTARISQRGSDVAGREG